MKEFYCNEVFVKMHRTRKPTKKGLSALELYKFANKMYDDDDITTQEYAYVILMDNSKNIIGFSRVGQGGITATCVDIRIVMRIALVQGATCIAFVHNHPSGSLTPSRLDDELTKRLKEACELMQIHFVDHLILTEDNYYSYFEQGKL